MPPPSLDSLAASDRPFVLADDHGVVIGMNDAFRDVYGWDDDEPGCAVTDAVARGKVDARRHSLYLRLLEETLA